MTSRAHIAIAAVLLGCVLFIFVSPVLNLPWTTLQANRQGVRLMMLVAVLACGILFSVLRLIFYGWRFHAISVGHSDSLIDITCTRRC